MSILIDAETYLADVVKTENEVPGKRKDLEVCRLHPQQDQGFPKLCHCSKGGSETKVVSDKTGGGKVTEVGMCFR